MSQKTLVAAIVAAVSANALADTAVHGAMQFDPIAGSAYTEQTRDPAVLTESPWKIPAGYRQYIVSDESDLDIYPGSPDWNDMNTANETGKHAGRYLFRTHEVRPDARNPGVYTGGAVSVVDLKTGAAKVVAQRQDWEALDGLVWTPWGTALFAEETGTAVFKDPAAPSAMRGLLYELAFDKKDPTTMASVTVRPMLGSMAHEGIELDAAGNVYVIDETAGGAIFKFVPKRRGDLSDGQLYALKVDGSTGDRTGNAEWMPLDMTLAQIDARTAAANVGATGYGRPEDLERIGDTLYAAITSEARVLAIALGDKPVVSDFVKAGVNVPVENKAAGVTGFRNPDNLANGPDGTLWIVEDNVPSDIWVATPDRDRDGVSDRVQLFASLKDSEAEGTGIYFGKDPHTLFVNIQHSATGNDKTVAITNRKLDDDGQDGREDDDLETHESDEKHRGKRQDDSN